MSTERHPGEEFGNIELPITWSARRFAQLAVLGEHTGHQNFANLAQSSVEVLKNFISCQSQGLSLVGLERHHANMLDRGLAGDPERLAFEDVFQPEKRGAVQDYFIPKREDEQVEERKIFRTVSLLMNVSTRDTITRLSKIVGVGTDQELIDHSIRLFETLAFHQLHNKTVYALYPDDLDILSHAQGVSGEVVLFPLQYDPTQHELLEEHVGHSIPRTDQGADKRVHWNDGEWT